MSWQCRNRQRRLKMLGLAASLLLVAVVTFMFMIAVVQLQAATTAYVSGQSAWSRSQLEAVYQLDVYAETGHPAALKRARDALAVPLGDRQARLALERDPLDEEAVYEGLRQGLNHVDDIGRMVWLHRHFADFFIFRQPLNAWRQTDADILSLAALADRLEAEWSAESPSVQGIAGLQARLADINTRLAPLADEFRRTMTGAARLVAKLLMIGSVVFLLALVLIAWLLGWRLTRLITAAERKFRASFEQVAVGMAQLDGHGYLIDVNQALCKPLGYPRQALLGGHYWNLVHPEDRELDKAQRKQLLAGTLDSYTTEQRLMCRQGHPMWIKLTISSVCDDHEVETRYVAILEDISESRRLSIELCHQANHDALTGLLNRRAFERGLADTLQQAHSEGSDHVLGFIDLDQFKVVNDTAGHAAGDQLLCQVTELLHQQLRESDLLARLGGDEFAIILKDCDMLRAHHVAERLRSALENASFVWENAIFRLGCSIGVVPITAASVDTASLQRTADIACSLAKERGRNCVYVLREDDQQLTQYRGEMQWLNRIRLALDERRLFLVAQRLERLDKPGRLRYEVLVRLTDEHGQVIPPGAFLPAAERFGVAHRIDRWVIEEVCTQLAAHPEHLAELEACHINLSGRSFDQADLGDFVVATLERHALPAEKLCFEITETAAVRSLTEVISFMERLGARGCTFALDDFGAGLSSFGYLRQLPVECIKIDGVFVRHIASDETDLAMVRAINEIGQTLNKIIVAEFVENEETLALLREMGMHYAQGYGIHPPCRFETLLTDRNPSGCAEPPPHAASAAVREGEELGG